MELPWQARDNRLIYGEAHDMGAAFSNLAFGQNTSFSDLAFAFGTVIPPIPVPVPVEEITGRGAVRRHRRLEEEEALYERRIQHRFDVQNRDDLDVVRILTEFLSRM